MPNSHSHVPHLIRMAFVSLTQPQLQGLVCDVCVQSPQSPHQRHAHAVTGLLLAAAATTSRIDAALATVLHRTDMVEEAMQFHLTVRRHVPPPLCFALRLVFSSSRQLLVCLAVSTTHTPISL